MVPGSGRLVDGPPRLAPADTLPHPHVEVITRSGGEGQAPRPPWYRARRLKVFLSVFLLVLMTGLVWDFVRPAQYRATATLLTERPPVDRNGLIEPGPDIQHVTIQGHLLFAPELLSNTLKRVGRETGLTVATTDELARMFKVTSVPDTNLVELGAIGTEPDQLAPLVNAWLAGYLDLRQRELEEEIGATLDALREEREALGATIRAKTETLELFRSENDIVTLERDGNEALSRLRALQQDLNRARDEAVEAEARLAAVEAAVARGDPVVPSSEQGLLDELEARASELRAKRIEMDQRFLPLFLENHPEHRVVPAQLEALEAQIQQKLAYGRELVLVQSRQEVEQAGRRVAVLERALARQKEIAADFTTGFARYQAMQTDLKGLQGMHQDLGARIAELEAKGLERYPPVEVIEAARPPTLPFYPHYWRDALWVLLAAAMSALVAVWLTDFLTRRPGGEEGPFPVTGVRVYAGGQTAAVGGAAPGLALPEQGLAAAISSPAPANLLGARPRELIPAEVEALWDLAEPISRQLMALLLSGLSPEECAVLKPDNFDLEDGLVRAPEPSSREIALAPGVRELFARSDPLPLWAGADYRQTPAELSRRIGLLAHDAGLSQPGEVSAETLRHSYLAFLVRQGARLTELERRAGAMSATELGSYAGLAPAGQAKPLADVETVYPTLKNPTHRDFSAFGFRH